MSPFGEGGRCRGKDESLRQMADTGQARGLCRHRQGIFVPSGDGAMTSSAPAKARESQRLGGDRAVETKQRQITADGCDPQTSFVHCHNCPVHPAYCSC
ncbi:hypothetical protein [Aquisediminimonas sediminicola]|uniref:hypothetical protein n=1 Tax=Alteraquisediminimonas sediminicola TaxID=2676787 RepID=UPI003CCEDE4F